VRDALAKGVPVDLHPTVFTDDVAVTIISHIGAIVWQSAPDRFSIAIFRSYAQSFWHWLAASAAEFGLVMETP
jgi:sarcosine oxidase subunit gamma